MGVYTPVILWLLCMLSFMLLLKWALNGDTTASVDAALYNLAWILPFSNVVGLDASFCTAVRVGAALYTAA